MRFDEICILLKNAGIDNSDGEAALLLEKFCGVALSSIPLLRNESFDSSELREAIRLRTERYPLQYIIGEWCFYNEKYIVSEHCLIPRSDTEILVEMAIKKLPEGAIFADLCTGSGCIAVSTLANRKDCRGYAFELYEKALDLARKNAELNGVSDRFFSYRSDVLKPIKVDLPPLDAILSNPPYIKTGILDSLDAEVKKEPIAALDGGEDGLVFYRAIMENHACLLKDSGFIAFEIGYDQGNDLRQLASLHGFNCEIFKDYGGMDRVALLTRGI